MNRVLIRHIIFLITLALLTVTGEAWAQQTTGQFVIKTGTGENTHYLSHANNTLGDATAFSPSVLWTSNNTYTQGGANRNYYFMEGNTPHFLGAPTFESFGELSLSSSLPLGNQLSNPESQYYFYRWDDGLGRGVQYYGVTHEWCDNNHPNGWNSNNECWEVYWVEYNASASTWKLSAESYGITTNGGKFYPVTITEHGIDTTILMVTVGEEQVPSGLQALQGFEMEFSDDPLANHQVTPTITNNEYQYTIRPAYTTYAFDGGTHNYYDAGTGLGDQGENTPGAVPYGPYSVSTYAWTLTGPGAAYLSFAETGTTYVHTSNANAPTIYYRDSNNDGHKTATLTLTVTYSNGSKQSSSATILVKTPCQNPTLLPNPVVNYVGATVSWTPTADSYKVYWQKKRTTALPWDSAMVANVTSYVITGLEYDTVYRYKVKATSCGSSAEPTQIGEFSTLAEPGLMVTGAIFGGGRMADVGGKTEVVIVNCDSIGAIFGGNDIAGTVLDTIRANHTAGYAGANITLGVDASSPYGYNGTYGPTPSNGKIRVSSVYGGGNGYYAYNGSSFVPATSSYTSETVAVGACVKAMTQSHQVGDVVWTNDGTTSKTLNFPSITNTAIIATNNLVKVDSIFGGAKNAFLTANSGDGDSIVINGGTVFAVFGGNNWGGSQGYGKHHIEVNGTTTNLAANITNTATTGYGRDFGIRYLFGGGNKVTGSTTDIHIKGGQSDEVFAGGNAADVYKANVMVECSLGADAGNHLTFGNTYTNAIDPSHYTTSGSPAQGTIGENTVFANYGWDGHSGIYNVRSLYGGNNMAEMQRVPNVTLTSGSVGTVYGGGNAGDMMGSSSTTINGNTVLYGTHVVLNSNQILADYIYGGCRMSDVYNSTWVELKKGHVGTVYGGCNISGDVGSTRVYDPYPSGQTYPQSLEEQRVKGATYVQAGAGGSDTDLIVYKNLFAGGNGYYNCPAEETPYGIHYGSDTNFDDPDGQYAGYTIPTHNETNVVVTAGTTVKGNVYAGGNLAAVGFDDNTGFYRGYPELVGMASVTMTGGRVEQNVYGGGNMASIFGRNEVRVSGGSIGYNSDGVATGGALYGGNDRAGQVAEKTNRKLPTGYGYTVASDNKTSLTTEGIKTFVGVSGNPRICTVYGGGNGDYIYGEGGIPYCGETPNQPIQPFTFVDIHINGGASGGKINTVYGGGNGVTVRGGAIVFMNIMEPSTPEDYTNVDTIFGGNNKGSLEIVADIRLLHGQVGTVYGGCNQGAMMAGSNSNNSGNLKTIGGYENIGSYVRLYNTYVASADSTHTVTAKVKDAVYGGCRMNGVTRNSLVLVEGGNFLNTPIYGGSDISGTVSGTSRVAVTGSTVNNAFVGGSTGNVYGGGNGGYYYKEVTNAYGTYYKVYRDATMAVQVADSVPNAPICAYSGVDVMGGHVGASGTGNNRSVFGGGFGQMTSTTGDVLVNVNNASTEIFGDVYGGSALGFVNTNASNLTKIDFQDGTLNGTVYGGGMGNATDSTLVRGRVQVDITNGSISGGVYGGCNVKGGIGGDIAVNINGGTVGATAVPANVFGGGYGHSTGTAGNVTVTVDKTGSVAPVVYGDIYGGSGLGSVNTLNNDNTTTVNILDGTLHGDIYGGGLGQKNGVNGATSDIAAIVNGKVYVNIGATNGGSNPTYTGNATINGDVYGCNNLNGTPMDSVFVNVYKTAHGNTPATNAYPSSPQITTVAALETNALTQAYAIHAVYGGGNQAAYTPPLANGKPREATVHIYGCQENTVQYVYGGGNAADVGKIISSTDTLHVNTRLIVDGGRIHQSFGGGNGAGDGNPGANIYGVAKSEIYAGLIDEVFGGANMRGSVDTIDLNIGSNSCGDHVFGKVFGCANEAPYNKSITTNILCGVGTIGELYGGSNKAAIGDSEHPNTGANVTLNLYGGGPFDNVFAGSKGVLNGTSAPIYGDVTLNLYGGTVTRAFGGSDQNGNITGTVTVNVLDFEDCPLKVDTIFGASNVAEYQPLDVSSGVKRSSPVINVMHIKDASDHYVHNVFGGGNLAEVKNANPIVNIGYDASLMSGLIPDHYPTTSTFYTVAPRAYVDYNVFGGGNLAAVTGTDTVNIRRSNSYVNNVFGGGNQAGTTNTVVNVYDGTVHTDVYGGCNSSGTVTGDIKVNLLGGTVTRDVFGGGMGSSTATEGNILVTVDGGTVTRDLYGGSALGQVNNEATDLTKVWLKSGTINGNLYGGGMGQEGAGYVTYGQVNGQVEVLVNGGTIGNGNNNTGNVFGCNNTNGAPQSSVKVYINEATANTMHINGNIYGGGNVAYCETTCEVYIQNGTINNKVFGGGNNISIDDKGVGGTYVLMTGGTVLDTIFGGCNVDGDVTGNSEVTILGGVIGATGAGNGRAIFGGGYGYLTNVQGDVTVTFGDLNADQSDSPKLIGDLYGGSALGNVNTATTAVTPYTTTVNVYNGEITGPVIDPIHPNNNIYGNVYGGGLGNADHPAVVKGVVYVNIGETQSPPSGMLRGKATLINCNVFGCNNVNGSPQDDVFVNVYQTAHIQGTNTVEDLDFAILQVFGGGNRANYAPENGDENSLKKAHVYIHACENTVRYVYGGGNAADAVGVITLVGGGHFEEVYGGGNGAFGVADIGKGGIGLNVMGGRISFLYAGSNKHGTNYGPNYEAVPMEGFIDCGELVVESFFFGDNEAEHYGDIVHTILCEDAASYHYTRLYAGSRWAIVYGDIKLTVCGGFIQSLFGGSMGYAINNYPAHVRMFPSRDEIAADLAAHPSGADTLNRKYSYDLRQFMNYDAAHPEYYKTSLVGKGGNIELIITGGTIGEAIGGCDELGNVEGKITVIVDDAEDPKCPLRIGNIFGASDYTYYEPCDYEYEAGNYVYYNPAGTHGNAAVHTPQVEIIHINEATGVAHDFNGNGTTGAAETFAGNIYGGANRGDIISNPRVTIGDGTTGTSATKVTIGGDVFGGGNLGMVTGSPHVVVVPNTHSLTFNNAPTGGTFTVSYPRGTSVSSPATIGEGISLRLEATPTPPTNTTGYVFDHWTVTGTGACVNNKNSASTLFTMGSANATISATFESKPARQLKIETDGGSGTFTVDGTPYSTSVYVVQTASVTVHVTPADGYAFDHWTVSGTGASISNANSTTTIFTMGTEDAILTAHFKTAYLLTLQANNDAYGLFRINGDTTNTIYLAEDDVATVVAVPTAAVPEGNGYLFNRWDDITTGGSGATLSSNTSASITVKMGHEATTLRATFNEVPARRLTMQAVAGGTPGTGGSFKVNGTNYTEPVWIAQGASVPIVATPANGYRFVDWNHTNTPENGTIGDLNAAYTVYIMGTTNYTVQAEFEAIATHTFDFVANPTTGGSITVTDSDGNPVLTGADIREYATLKIVADAEDGYVFTGWTIVETGANTGAAHVVDATVYQTYFTMGRANVTLTAHFAPAHRITLAADGNGSGSFTVNDVPYTDPVLIQTGSSVTIEAIPGTDSTFGGWTVVSGGVTFAQPANTTQTFTISADTEIKGRFNQR